jgi:uncharacterized hydrophobic protein (TIGR00271 family)
MLQLRVFGPTTTLGEVASELRRQGYVRHLVLSPSDTADRGLLTADIEPDFADQVLSTAEAAGVPPVDATVLRLEEITPPRGRPAASLVWADMMGQARRNARPIARFLVFMLAAGVIAGFGVITVNSTLIVGAMAVSPDTLPITAACVALVALKFRLAARALATLVIGLAATCAAAAVATGILDATGRLPSGFHIGQSALSGLVTIGPGTIGVALAAGVAAMLALETRASAAVGVAISVTTIPAAAYLGVAAAVGEAHRAWGSLAVLGVNVAMLLVGGIATLLVQRLIARRDRRPASVRNG